MMAVMKHSLLRGVMKIDEPMARYTSWRVGGVADRMYSPADAQDLAEFLRILPAQENLLWLGLGSNLLVRDGGIRGTVISLKGCLAEVNLLDDSRIDVGAGISCAKLARFCSKNNLLGGEFFAGIPGLLGGALAMNAGAFGAETWNYVESVTTLSSDGHFTLRQAKEFTPAYRSVSGTDNEWFVSAVLKFSPGDGEEAAQKIRLLLAQRAQTQPIGVASCGSVFRNPEGDYAARLIEACHLKGYKKGAAVVSGKHANFIINNGDASAQDIEDLIYYVQQQVKLQQGVELQTEVKIVGEPIHAKIR
jgi:UDP-N-acetylmuramate dehydrogenase